MFELVVQASNRAAAGARVIVLAQVIVSAQAGKSFPVVALNDEPAIVTEHFRSKQQNARDCSFDLFQLVLPPAYPVRLAAAALAFSMRRRLRAATARVARYITTDPA